MTSDQVAQRVTSQRVAAEQDDVEREHERTDADAEFGASGCRINEPQGSVDVVEENAEEDQRDVEEVAMDVLEHQRKRLLAAVRLARLTDAARGRVGPEGLAVRAAVVVTGEPEKRGKGQNDQGGGERKPSRPPAGARA